MDNTPKEFKSGETIRLKPGESALVDGHLTLTNEGYGHKILMEGGDLGLVGLKLQDGNETCSKCFFQGKPEKLTWREWMITMTNCEDGGPPHNRDAATEWLVEKKN